MSGYVCHVDLCQSTDMHKKILQLIGEENNTRYNSFFTFFFATLGSTFQNFMVLGSGFRILARSRLILDPTLEPVLLIRFRIHRIHMFFLAFWIRIRIH